MFDVCDAGSDFPYEPLPEEKPGNTDPILPRHVGSLAGNTKSLSNEDSSGHSNTSEHRTAGLR